MTTLINNWFKQIFIHQASSSCQKKTPTDQCIIVDKPSTMSDVDAMHCDDVKKPPEIKSLIKNDTIITDKFQACFIDCACQCEVIII